MKSKLFKSLFVLVCLSYACTNEQNTVDVNQQSSMETVSYNPSEDFEAIKAVMAMQEKAWSAADPATFMQGYWKSKELTFVGSSGLTYGWDQTLSNYKKNYPDADAMGQLEFEIIELKSLSPEYCYMIGGFELYRQSDTLDGYFTLLWQKIQEEWKIIADQSCG